MPSCACAMALISPPQCPPTAHIASTALPCPPRAFPVPAWHPGARPSVKHPPLSLRKGTYTGAYAPLSGLSRPQQRQVGGGAQLLTGQIFNTRYSSPGECKTAHRLPLPHPLSNSLTGRSGPFAQVLVLCFRRRCRASEWLLTMWMLARFWNCFRL